MTAVFIILGTKDCVVWTWVVDSGYYEGSVQERETEAYLLYCSLGTLLLDIRDSGFLWVNIRDYLSKICRVGTREGSSDLGRCLVWGNELPR